MKYIICFFLVTMTSGLLAAQTRIAVADTTVGSVIFPFYGGGCGLTEHDAPSGTQIHLDIREFVRYGVECVASTGGYTSTGWPATGSVNVNKFVSFHLIPEPGYEAEIYARGLTFAAQRSASGPDSVEVVLYAPFRPPRTLLRARLTSDQRQTFAAAAQPIRLQTVAEIRFYAWSSQPQGGGVALGTFLVDDVGLLYRTYPGQTTASVETARPAETFSLSEAFPNPFNPGTSVTLHMKHRGRVKLEVFNNTGQRVRLLLDRELSAGVHAIQFNAGDLPSSSYTLRASSESEMVVRRIVLIR